MKFDRQMQNHMPLAIASSRSKPEMESLWQPFVFISGKIGEERVGQNAGQSSLQAMF